jgi:hypothetical protein
MPSDPTHPFPSTSDADASQDRFGDGPRTVVSGRATAP